MTVTASQCLTAQLPDGYFGSVGVTVKDEDGNQLENYPLTWSTSAGRLRSASTTTRSSLGYAEVITPGANDKPM